jgi:DNA-binding NarL/FixJ family response regulator
MTNVAASSDETRNIVVADGDQEARAELAGVLTEAGYRVLEATTGEQAFAAARQLSPALVILEVPLPGISGYEVCRRLRQELGDETPIVFLSGVRTESYDRVAGLLVGADDYIVKPYAVDELLVRVRRLIDRTWRVSSGSLEQLTVREREVLRLLAEGLSAKEVATLLVISPKTVRTHIEHILVKLNVRSRIQAVAIAFREGLTSAEARALPASPGRSDGAARVGKTTAAGSSAAGSRDRPRGRRAPSPASVDRSAVTEPGRSGTYTDAE